MKKTKWLEKIARDEYLEDNIIKNCPTKIKDKIDYITKYTHNKNQIICLSNILPVYGMVAYGAYNFLGVRPNIWTINISNSCTGKTCIEDCFYELLTRHVKNGVHRIWCYGSTKPEKCVEQILMRSEGQFIHFWDDFVPLLDKINQRVIKKYESIFCKKTYEEMYQNKNKEKRKLDNVNFNASFSSTVIDFKYLLNKKENISIISKMIPLVTDYKFYDLSFFPTEAPIETRPSEELIYEIGEMSKFCKNIFESNKMVKDVKYLCDLDKLEKLINFSNKMRDTVLCRYSENVQKIALVTAIIENYKDPIVTQEIFDWAQDVVYTGYYKLSELYDILTK